MALRRSLDSVRSEIKDLVDKFLIESKTRAESLAVAREATRLGVAVKSGADREDLLNPWNGPRGIISATNRFHAANRLGGGTHGPVSEKTFRELSLA